MTHRARHVDDERRVRRRRILAELEFANRVRSVRPTSTDVLSIEVDRDLDVDSVGGLVMMEKSRRF